MTSLNILSALTARSFRAAQREEARTYLAHVAELTDILATFKGGLHGPR